MGDSRRLVLERTSDSKTGHHSERVQPANRLKGNPSFLVEGLHIVSTIMTWLNELCTDLAHGFSRLRRESGFTVAVLLALALGIGANTAIFTVARAALLKPVPYPGGDRIMMIWESVRERGWDQFPVSAPDFLDWRRDANQFTQIAGFADAGFNLQTVGGGAERIDGMHVTDRFFDVLGIMPRIGRPILPGDVEGDGTDVAILTDSLWKRTFNADPAVLGRKLVLDGKPFTVIGVMPAHFEGLNGNPQIYTPFAFSKEQRANRGFHWFLAVGRLKPGAALETARTQMDGIAQRISSDFPNTNRGFGISLIPAAEQAVEEIKPLVLILWGTVGVVLLIACANVANLLLARGHARRREFAIRTASGAGRGRILRQLLAESTLLSLCGGALGLLPAWWGADLLTKAGIEGFPKLQDLRPDATMALFALGISLVTGVLFGIVPALNLAGVEVGEALKNLNPAAAAGSLRHKARSVFIVAEVALSLVLLVGAGLLLRSLMHLSFADPGFQPDSVLTMSLALGDDAYKSAASRTSFIDRYIQEAKVLPGVQFAAVGSGVPLMESSSVAGIQIEGVPRDPKNGPSAAAMKASPDYFHALGIPVKQGRAFSDSDRVGTLPVAVVNETFVRRYLNGENPIGKRFRSASRREWMTIVGVVGDVRAARMTPKVGATFYEAIAQNPDSSLVLTVKTAIPPEKLSEPIRRLVLRLDPGEPVYGVQTMAQLMATSMASERVATILVTGFASLAVLLALMGIYSVVSYSVVSTTRDLAIRMALGAQASDVLYSVMKQALVLVAIGVGIGIAGAYGVSQALTTLLHGVSPTDPATFTGTLALMVITATLATFVPARRVLRLDPIVALRQE